METVNAMLSKGSDDFGAWLEDLEGVYGAGETPGKALKSLKRGVALYIKHNADAPMWLENMTKRDKPSAAQLKELETAFKKLGNELIAVEL